MNVHIYVVLFIVLCRRKAFRKAFAKHFSQRLKSAANVLRCGSAHAAKGFAERLAKGFCSGASALQSSL